MFWNEQVSRRAGKCAELWPLSDGSPLILLGLFGLNIYDGLVTLIWIKLGVATEANPMLENIIEHSALQFLAVKLSLVLLGCLLLWRFREEALARQGAYLLTAIYFILACYHLQFFFYFRYL